MPIDPDRRRAALIATAVTVPFIVVVTLVLVALASNNTSTKNAGSSDTPLPPVTASAPPHANTEVAACSKVLEQLPVSLGKLTPRVVHTKPDTPFVVAWGQPPVLLACGAARPKDLVPGSSVQFITGGELDGPYYDVQKAGNANVYTTVDRQPYVAITIPAKYSAGDYLPILSRAIAKALPAVCVGTQSGGIDPDKLCTRRPN